MGGRSAWAKPQEPADPTVAAAGAIALAPDTDGVWRGVVPAQPAGTRVRYRIAARPRGEAWVTVEDAGPGYVAPTPDRGFVRPPRDGFSFVVGMPGPPDWVVDGVGYHLLVDRFATDDGGQVAAEDCEHLAFAGGTIRGATARLDHISDVGATFVLLSPITPGQMNLPYDVTDLCGIDDRVGSADDVRAFVDRAHRLGLRVVLDLELSYLGGQHPAAIAALGDPAAPERDWFHRDADRLWGWMAGNPMFRPVDHHHEPVRRRLLASLGYWFGLGFDGFRLDSAHAASLDFWAEMGVAARSHRPDCLLVGELTVPYAERVAVRGRLNAVLDFDVEQAVRSFATGDGARPTQLVAAVTRALAEPALASVTFVESHDDDRVGWLAEGDEARIRLPHLLLLTLPGTPLLLYGTEVGLVQQPTDGYRDHVRRGPMPWRDPDRDRLAWTTALVRLRRDRAALRRGDFEAVAVDDDCGLVAFVRRVDGDAVLVAVNGSTSEVPLDLDWAGTLRRRLGPASGVVIDAAGRVLAATGR